MNGNGHAKNINDLAQQRWALPDAPEGGQWLDAEKEEELRQARWPEGLVGLLKVQEAEFQRVGLAPETAYLLAKAGIMAIAKYYGGRQWYLPKGDGLHTALRDAEIYRRANRDNIEELADEYKLTVQSIYRIVKEQQRLHVEKRQGQLLFSGEAEPAPAQ